MRSCVTLHVSKDNWKIKIDFNFTCYFTMPLRPTPNAQQLHMNSRRSSGAESLPLAHRWQQLCTVALGRFSAVALVPSDITDSQLQARGVYPAFEFVAPSITDDVTLLFAFSPIRRGHFIAVAFSYRSRRWLAFLPCSSTHCVDHYSLCRS